MIGKSVLFSEMRPGRDWEGDFNTWYAEDHIPVRMAIDGFEGAQRYHATDNADYLVIYDMTSLDVLKTPEYQVVKNEPSEQTKWMLENVSNFTRYLGNEIGRHGTLDEKALEAPIIFTARFNVPEEACDDFDAWMAEDHAPLLLQCDVGLFREISK